MGVAGFIGLHLVILLALAATAWAAGRSALAVLRLEFKGRLEDLALSVAAGLAVLAHVLFVLAVLGVLSRWSVVAVVAVVHLQALSRWRELLRRPGWGRPWAWLVGWVALAPLFVLALYPPLAFDETLYHLPMARAFAESGGMPFVAELRVPVFPPLAELLSAAMLLLAGDVATHLVQLLATLATAGLLVAWGQRELSATAGWLAAALFVGGPVVVHLAATSYVEPLLALLTAAAFYCVYRFISGESRGWLIAAGFFAGSAAGVKYLGLLAVGAIGLTLFVRGGRRWRNALVFGAAATAFLAPTYLRLALLTGNPVFPLLPELFGSTAWNPVPAGRAASPGEALSRIVTLAWDVIARRPRVGWQPPFTPWLLPALPVLALGAVRDRVVRWLAGVSALWLLAFAVLPPDVRYLLAPWPLVALAAGLVAARWVAGRPWLAATLAVALFFPGWLYAGWRVARQGLPPSTVEARDAFLAARLALYPAISHLNRTHGKGYTLYALHAEQMSYYVQGRHFGDWVGLGSYAEVEPLLADPPALHRALRELGADYILVAPGRIADGPLFRRVYEDGVAEVLELPEPAP